MNEWYAKDMSRKMRSTLKTKDSQGYAIGQPPLGYKKDPDNPKLWVIDEEGAQIVEKIYNLRSLFVDNPKFRVIGVFFIPKWWLADGITLAVFSF